MNERRRYVIFFRGGSAPADEMRRLLASPHLRIVESIPQRAILAEATIPAITAINREFPAWTVAEETIHPAPTPVTPPDPQTPGSA